MNKKDKLPLFARKDLLSKDFCKPDTATWDISYVKELLILKPDALAHSYLDPEYQYFFATGGFGASPKSRGTKVFGNHIYDNTSSEFKRSDFYGIADLTKAPQWVINRVAEISPKYKEIIENIDGIEIKEVEAESKKDYSALPDTLKDKMLLAVEQAMKVGINPPYDNTPITDYFTSSAKEYYVDVEGAGWLNALDYEKVRNNSGLSEQEFNNKLTHISAYCIDCEGNLSVVEMPVAQYDLMYAKTYDPSNADTLAAYTAAYNERIKASGQPTEKASVYYAISDNQYRGYTFDVLSMLPNGTLYYAAEDISRDDAIKFVEDKVRENDPAVRVEIVTENWIRGHSYIVLSSDNEIDPMEAFIRILHDNPDRAFDYISNNYGKLRTSELVDILRELVFAIGNEVNTETEASILRYCAENLADNNDVNLNLTSEDIGSDDIILPFDSQGNGRK